MSIVRSPRGYYTSTLLSRHAWVEHAFGTALASPAPGYLLLNQIHSATICDAAQWSPELQGDALVSQSPATPVAVKTADCVPLLLADPAHQAVAAVHAGWRGVLSGIAGMAIERMAAAYGSRARDLTVALGPSIGLCCFEVGPEVAIEFGELFPERSDLLAKTKIDLREALLRQLLKAGVPGAQIDADAPCTCCGGAEFYSWRRDHIPGQRMFSAIGISAACGKSSR